MSYFWTCPHCGANLDPGEKCTCQEQEDINRRYHRHNKQFIKNLEDITNGQSRIETDDYRLSYGY